MTNTTHVLPNGVTVVAENMSTVRSVAFGLWVRGGSRAEGAHGAAHFLEHMMFRGTNTRSGADIAYQVDAIGGHINAFTSKEHTCYYTVTLDEHADTAMEIIADMFFNSRLDEDDISKEKAIIHEEIDMVEDTADDLVYELLQQSVWEGSQDMAHPILGTKESVGGLERGILERHLRAHPSDVVIAVAGNIGSIDALLPKLERFFGGVWPGDRVPVSRSGVTSYRPCITIRCKPIEQLHLLLGFPGTTMGSAQRYDMAVLNTILGAGMSSVLFQRIREEMGLAYSVYSHNSSFTDTGLLYIYAGVSPSNANEALRAILEEVAGLLKINETQLRHAQAQIKSSLLLGLESTQSRMMRLGRGYISLGRTTDIDEISSGIQAVSLESLQRLAYEVLKNSRMSMSAIGPLTKDEERVLTDLLGGYGLTA